MTEVELVRHELESRIREHADAIDKLTAEREQYKKLKGYTGYLVADAHAVYDHLYASGDVVEGCSRTDHQWPALDMDRLVPRADPMVRRPGDRYSKCGRILSE